MDYESEIVNRGERLYRKGLVLREQKDKQNKEIKLENEKVFKQSYTFKPKLNKDSMYLSIKVDYFNS
jgi:hypothetical protein